MSETEEKRLFKLTESDVSAIRAAMAECDGLWSLVVRTGENWEPKNRASILRSDHREPPGSDGFQAEGYELGVFFDQDATVLGDLTALNDAGVTYANAASTWQHPGSLTDLSPLANLTQLTSLNLTYCIALTDISPLQQLSQLNRLDLTRCEALTDISGLQGLTQLKRLDLSNEALTDISGLQGLTRLNSLNLLGCEALTNLSPLQGLTQLNSLYLYGCEAVTDISPLQQLSQLNKLDLSSCIALTDISPLQHLTQLTRLDLYGCQALTDISPLQHLTQLNSLRISNEALTDISPLQTLTQLTSLELSYCTALTDISPLQHLTQLKSLELSGCFALTDISPLQHLTQLNSLRISNEALTDISPLQALTQLTSLNLGRCRALTDISPLQHLTQLKSLNLRGCALTDITPLQGLTQLTSLELYGCEALNDLSGLQGLTQLTSLELSDCPELADNSKWGPLESLSALRELKGSFPSHLVTRLAARNAANRGDWSYVEAKLGLASQRRGRRREATWSQVADQNADQPGLLTAIGQAAALDPAGYETLATLLTLAATHDAPEVDGLLAVACPLADAHDAVGAALNEAVEQAERPLPPETLVALHQHLPSATTLRDQTLLALSQAVDQTDAPAWAMRSAQALREHVQDARYPVTPAVREAVAQALQDQAFGALETGLFGALCSDHARADDAWRDPFHQTLSGLALAQSDANVRNQALSDLAEGLALAGPWGETRLDALLEAAAAVDPDTSALQAAVARAHATAGRWDAAERAVYAVARPAQRDDCLKALATDVLNTDLTDRAQRAVALETGLSDPFERIERLVALGSSPVLLADPVAYGQLVALLAEQPEAQQQVITTAITARPALSEAQVPDALAAVTERERTIAENTQRALLQKVAAIAPDVAVALGDMT